MAETPSEYLDGVAACFAAGFQESTVTLRDDQPERCILEMWGRFGDCRTRLLEIVAPDAPRKYAYYALRAQRVIAGFDNAPDPRALKLKHGPDYAEHRLERIPHRHTEDKTGLELTDEMTCADFVAWVKANLRPTP
ncbi:MAG: hypothetical protein FJ030_18185 [Chloroflexi bacterium]|nr:hypothetical protein [Chloroflexota bacterium]